MKLKRSDEAKDRELLDFFSCICKTILTFKVNMAVAVQVNVPQDVLQITVSDLQTTHSFRGAVGGGKTARLL